VKTKLNRSTNKNRRQKQDRKNEGRRGVGTPRGNKKQGAKPGDDDTRRPFLNVGIGNKPGSKEVRPRALKGGGEKGEKKQSKRICGKPQGERVASFKNFENTD